MHNIIKRLEIIKSSIDVDDEEIIELQISKLEKLQIDNEVSNIIEQLKSLDYGKAMVDIEEYLKKFRGVTKYVDAEIQGLKLELKVLEKKLQKLSEQKTEYLNDINEFNRQYHLKLGGLISEILKLKQEILQKNIAKKENKHQSMKEKNKNLQEEIDDLKKRIKILKEKLDNTDIFDDEYDKLSEELNALKNEYKNKQEALNEEQEKLKEFEESLEEDDTYQEFEEAKQSYEEFSNEYEEEKNKNINTLSKDELVLLKKIYRKAARLCHPDIVPDALKPQALKLIQELNDAYEQKNLKKVQQILASLESGDGFKAASDTINDKEQLKKKIEQVRAKIDEILREIDEIENSETFMLIQTVNDKELYFVELQQELEKEIDTLKMQLHDKVADDETPKPQHIDTSDAIEDYFWEEEF